MDPDLNNSPQNSGSVSTAEALADLNEEIANSGQPQNTQEIPALDPGFENLSFSQKLEQLDPNHKNTGGNSLADFGKTGVTGKFNSPVNKVSFYLVPEKGAITDDFHNLTNDVKDGVYESVSSAIDDLQSVNDQEALKQLKGKLRLAANPGIFFENGQLKIGPGVSKEEIINFVKQKSTEEEKEPKAPDPLNQRQQINVAGMNLGGGAQSETPLISDGREGEQNPGTEEKQKSFDAGEIVPLAEENKTEDVSDILNQPKKDETLTQEPTPELKREGTMPIMGNITNIGEVPIIEEKEKEFFEKPRLVVKNTSNPDENRRFEGASLEQFKEPGDLAEWEELEKLRNDLARVEYKKVTTIGNMVNVGDLRVEYEAKKQKLANLLKQRLTGVVEGPLNQEQQKFFDDTVFEQLIQKENEAYLNAVKEYRGETWKDKAKEALRTVAGLKAVTWYLKQGKWARAAINTGLFGVAVGVGTFVGGGAAMTAMGATAFRGVRAVGSILGSGSGIAIDKKRYKQIEQVDEEEKTKIEEIKNNPNLSLEEKSKQYTEARENFDKERRWIAKRKAMFMVGGGVLGGSAMGGIFNLAYSGTGGSSALETEKRGGFDQNRTHRGISKFSQEPVSPKSDAASTMDQSVKSPNSQDLAAVEPEVKVKIQELNKSQVGQSEPTKPEVAETPVGEGAEVSESVTPKASEKPEVSPVPETEIASTPKTSAPESIPPLKPETLIHQVKAGDSVWKMLKETLENNDKFKNLSGAGSLQEIADQIEAKQTRVLQSLVDEVLKNNEKYGIGSNGEISVGQKVDFSNLFADSKKLETLLNEAENLKPAQITSIIDSNHKIETWLSENPGKQLDLDEIVNQKPKVFEMPKTEPAVPELPMAPEMEPPPISVSEELEKLKPVSPEAPFQDVETPESQPEPERVRLRLAQNEVVDPQAKLAANEEVIRVKRELGILEGGRERLRTMSSDTSVVAKTAEINEAVNQIFNNEIDSIYGESHLLGLQKIAGVATKEWKTISGLPAKRVLEYFGNPEDSDLPQTVLQELQTSEKHRKLVEWIASLVEEAHKHSNADFRPYDNGENIENYIKRLGGFLIKQQNEPHVVNKIA